MQCLDFKVNQSECGGEKSKTFFLQESFDEPLPAIQIKEPFSRWIFLVWHDLPKLRPSLTQNHCRFNQYFRPYRDTRCSMCHILADFFCFIFMTLQCKVFQFYHTDPTGCRFVYNLFYLILNPWGRLHFLYNWFIFNWKKQHIQKKTFNKATAY